jgi:hypothetical protein
MIPDTSRTGDDRHARIVREPRLGVGRDRVRRTLGELFPESPAPGERTWGLRTLSAAAQVAAVAVATAVMLLRIPGLPSWDTIYAEDYFEFLTQAIAKPWNIFIGYNSDWQFLPRVIAQVVARLPITDASRAFAVAGALVAACCALLIYHASSGHIRSAWLRALLAASLVLLPAAPMEIIDSGVNSVWYMLPALFWVLLWRPRTRTAMVVVALFAFAAAASSSLGFLFAPLVAARLYVLRRPREHAVTIGWLAGCLAQVPFAVSAYQAGSSRLSVPPAPPGVSLSFYGHDVVLPAFGWHLVWWLRSLAGLNGATALVAVVLALIFGVILATQPGTRPLVVAALLTGFVFPVFGITVTAHLGQGPMLPAEQLGNRYTVLPIFLFVSAVIVAVDHALRQRRTPAGHRAARSGGVRPVLAVTALVAVLAFSWVADFRYAGWRSNWGWNWAPIAATWQHDCAVSATGDIAVKAGESVQTLPCAHIRLRRREGRRRQPGAAVPDLESGLDAEQVPARRYPALALEVLVKRLHRHVGDAPPRGVLPELHVAPRLLAVPRYPGFDVPQRPVDADDRPALARGVVDVLPV